MEFRTDTSSAVAPGPTVARRISEWREALSFAGKTAHALGCVSRAMEAGRTLRSPILNALSVAAVEIAADLHDKAGEHAADLEHALALALMDSGPVEVAMRVYEGFLLDGVPRVHVRDTAAPECGHAACDVDGIDGETA